MPQKSDLVHGSQRSLKNRQSYAGRLGKSSRMVQFPGAENSPSKQVLNVVTVGLPVEMANSMKTLLVIPALLIEVVDPAVIL